MENGSPQKKDAKSFWAMEEDKMKEGKAKTTNNNQTIRGNIPQTVK
jgi:hypothetical protein